MRKPKKRLAEALFAAGLLLAGPLAHARFTRLFGVALKPRDNVKDCLPAVQKELSRIDLKKWGPVQFDCQAGYVRSLFVPADSLADREINRFVEKYWRLFDADKVSLVDAGYPWLTFVFKRAGLPFHVGSIDSGRRPGPNGGEMAFYDLAPVFSVPDGFAVKPHILKTQASTRALEIAAKRGHMPNRVESTQLIINDECLNLRAAEPKPELVWWIQIREAGNAKPVSCFIDAGTGEACKRNPGCSSSNDAFSL